MTRNHACSFVPLFFVLLWQFGSLVAPDGVAAAGSVAAGDRPNIILILADDLSAGDLGCYGHTFHETPHLDRMATEGARFTQAYSAAPVCSPTRAALLTGRYPARLGLTDWLPGLPDSPKYRVVAPKTAPQLPAEPSTLAERLKQVGYRTASIGKWHLGGRPAAPDKRGFEVTVGGDSAGSPTKGYFKFNMQNLQARSDEEYVTDRLTEEAEKFIRESSGKPFFLYLPHFAVHSPLQAKETLTAKYRATAPGGMTADRILFAAMLDGLDQGVGRIRALLTELGIEQNTLVLFTADNGHEPQFRPTSLPQLRSKGTLYEDGLHVPLLACGSGVVPRAVDAPVFTCDLTATILDECGAADSGGDGASLAPLLRGTADLVRESMFWHYPHYSPQGGKPSSAIRRGNFKLIEHLEDGRVELFDLASDPWEAADLASAQPARTAEMHKLLASWREQVGAALPTSRKSSSP